MRVSRTLFSATSLSLSDWAYRSKSSRTRRRSGSFHSNQTSAARPRIRYALLISARSKVYGLSVSLLPEGEKSTEGTASSIPLGSKGSWPCTSPRYTWRRLRSTALDKEVSEINARRTRHTRKLRHYFQDDLASCVEKSCYTNIIRRPLSKSRKAPLQTELFPANDLDDCGTISIYQVMESLDMGESVLGPKAGL